jgi:hypothetical protein
MATKRRKIFIGIGAVVLVISAIAFWPARDPMYKGHHLSEWVALSNHYVDDKTKFDPSETEILEAVMATAPNNIPLLIDWISGNTDFPLLARILEVMPRSATLHIAKIIIGPLRRRYERANGAAHAFKVLSSEQGAAAIPQLQKIVATGRLSSRERALNALIFIEKPAIPALVSIASTDDPSAPPIRFMAMGALSRNTDEPIVQAFLIKAAKDTNAQVALVARESLTGKNIYRH